MSDFVAILNVFKDFILGLFNLDIPLGSDGFAIKFGTVVLGVLGFPMLLNILARLFGDSAGLATMDSNKVSRIRKDIGKD